MQLVGVCYVFSLFKRVTLNTLLVNKRFSARDSERATLKARAAVETDRPTKAIEELAAPPTAPKKSASGPIKPRPSRRAPLRRVYK